MEGESGIMVKKRRHFRILTFLYGKKRLIRVFLKTLAKKTRAGMTLIEMSLAIAIAATMTVMITSTVAEALALQLEADRLSIAVSLAQIKLAQLLSNPQLSTTTQRGNADDVGGIYRGYTYEIVVKEEKIDLAKVAETGELKPVNIKDQLPPGGPSQQGQSALAGSATTQTGGLVDIVRIIVKINYPKGGGAIGEYRVETFRDSKKETSSGTGTTQ